MNHLEALRTIAEYPASAQDDMQAANMRKIAQEALAGGVERLRSGVPSLGAIYEAWHEVGADCAGLEWNKFATAIMSAQSAPEGLGDADLEDPAHSANQEALSFGLNPDVFARYFKQVRDRAQSVQAVAEPDDRAAFELAYATEWQKSRAGDETVEQLAAEIKGWRNGNTYGCDLPRLKFGWEGYQWALAASPALPTPKAETASIWANFPAYLIDHCEGEVITEEGLQRALSDMLQSPQYKAQPAVEPVAITDEQDLDFVISPDALRPDDRILVPRGLLGAACDAINKKRDAPKTLAELRRYAFGYLSSPAPAPNALDAERWRTFVGLPHEIRAEWAANLSAVPVLNHWVDQASKGAAQSAQGG